MADEVQNYRLQLQQVEAALLSDPDNKELLKLRVDLEEIIELTQDLKSKPDAGAEGAAASAGGAAAGSSNALLGQDEDPTKKKVRKIWATGDICMAKWSGNNQYYEAKIDSITAEGVVNVTFEAYKNRGVTSLGELRDFTGIRKALTDAERLKKIKMQNKEYVKKKKQKKQARFKELEEERETEKNKWLAFNMKASKTKKAGLTAKSIFASPENVNGRVGIGTCGISGRPMTDFATAEKWRKGT